MRTMDFITAFRLERVIDAAIDKEFVSNFVQGL